MGESDLCTRCGHPLDPHELRSDCLVVLGGVEVPVAGWMVCPQCDCWSTWSVDHPDLPPEVVRVIEECLEGLRALRALEV